MVDVSGIEPLTYSVSSCCTTAVLNIHIEALSKAGLGGNQVAETFASADTRLLLPL